jgi:hypothetical protein
MWSWLQYLAIIAGGIVFVLYILTNIVVGLLGVFDFFRFYYRLIGGTISIREMREEIKKRG